MKLYKSLTEQPDQPKIKHIMYTLGIKGDLMNFLNTPTARGLITNDILTKFKNIRTMKSQAKLWLHLAMDSWLSALYNVIWKQRNKLTFQMNKDFPIQTNQTTPQPHINLIHRTNDIDINIPGCNIRSLRFKINLTPPQSNKRKRINLIVKPRTRTRIENVQHRASSSDNIRPIYIKLNLPRKHPCPTSTLPCKRIKLIVKHRPRTEIEEVTTPINTWEEVNPDVGEDPGRGEDGPERTGCLDGSLRSNLDQVNRLDGSYD